MKKTITILFVILTSSFAFAGRYEDAWNDTSYDFTNLFNEEGFESNQCQESLKDFSACLMALNFLANSLPEELTINLNPEAHSVSLVNKDASVDMTDYEVAMAQVEEFKESIEALYSLEAPTSLEPLFEELYDKAKKLEKDVGFIAGHTFSVYVTNAYDPVSAVIPESLMYGEPNKYVGMGAEVSKERDQEGNVIENSPVDIIRPFKGSPAEHAGLKRGDKIMAIDGVDATTISLGDVVNKIIGEPYTPVILSIKRFCTGVIEDVVVTRGPITQKADILEDSRFVSFKDFTADPKSLECNGDLPAKGEAQALYIPLKSFESHNPNSDELSLYQKFISLQVQDLNNPDSLGMILDLRNNGGGDLDQTLKMLDSVIHSDELLFTFNSVEKGKLIGNKKEVYARATNSDIIDDLGDDDPSTNKKIFYKRPIIVLINGGSASASEVVAGSLQDFERGWIVGQKSFGKGSVQTLRPHTYKKPELGTGPLAGMLMNHGEIETRLKTTTAIYSLHSGRSPQRVGITPDFWYSPKGEEPTEAEHDISERSKEFNAITGFENIEWKQTRPKVKAVVAECAHAEDSLSQQYLKNMKSEGFPTSHMAFPNYQDLLARDVLRCFSEMQKNSVPTE